MSQQTAFGRIAYTSKKPDRMDADRGREWFTMTKHSGGSRTLTAHSEIDDAPPVIRDVSLTVGGDWRPRDSSVRLTVGGDFMGSAWFRFSDQEVECQTFTANEGRLDQRVAVTERPKGFGNHAIASDGWLLNCYDLSKGPGTQFLKDMMTSSSDHRGATGPTIFQLGFGIEYVGEEKSTVGAGTFDALHFRIVGTEGQLPETHPPYDMWCTADGDYILLRGAVTGYMMTHYELVELQR
jgi:hypothetical protein